MSDTSPSNALAIDGGPQVRTDPWPDRRLFGEEEKQAVTALFDEAMEKGNSVLGYNGPQEQGYCQEFAEMLGGGFADAVNSGTNAVYIALRALEPEPFTEVIVPAISDPGGVMPVCLCNCIPVPADCAPNSYNIGPEQIEQRLTDLTSAIIVAHIAGTPADMDPIMELARGRNLPVIEDCAQSHGATYKGKPLGSVGDLSTFSMMHGKHHATAGQGGLVFTRSEDLYWKVRRFADRGKPINMDNSNGNVVASLNCNMDELHSTIGRVQLRKLPEMVRSRRRIAAIVDEGCGTSLKAVRLMADPPGCESAYWFFFFRLDVDKLRVDKNTFVEALAAEGIPAAPSYRAIPVEMAWYRDRAVFGSSRLPWSSPLYKGDPDQKYPVPNAEAANESLFIMPMHENCTDREIQDTVDALKKVERAYRE